MTLPFTPRYFDPRSLPGATTDADGSVTVALPGNQQYVYSLETLLAVNAALATQRPLLVAGSPGTGKTSLAGHVAAVLGRRYDELVITSRTRARDLMWRYDPLQRLAAAHQGAALPSRAELVEPQLLWWAFDAASAARRGLPAAQAAGRPLLRDPARGGPGPQRVVLLDEIDKAEPDVPNDLLEVLDKECFHVDDLDGRPLVQGRRADVLVVITTNRERELPGAFVRRCVVLDLDRAESDWEAWLVRVANQRYGVRGARLHKAVAALVMQQRRDAEAQGLRKPGTAEYLDTVVACRQLKIGPASSAWQQLAQALLGKARASSAAGRGLFGDTRA